MSMHDAFQYFTRMAQLVAEDSVPGVAPLATPTTKVQARGVRPSRHPGGLIRIVRTRLRSALSGRHPNTRPGRRTAPVVPFLAAADIVRAEDAAA
jgi:hypothetical protein